MNPTHLSIPVYECGVQAGFPSPAESYVDKSLDLNEYLVSNPASTFFVYVTGDSMDLAGMDEGDLLVVDRSPEPKNGDIVIMSINNEFTVKRYVKDDKGLRLLPESSNPIYKPILPKDYDEWRFIVFALVDGNSFFASCEKVFRPDLTDRPVIVLSNNDGCVVARSKEAKQLGIKMCQPYFQIEEFCIRENVAVFSSNYELYANLSGRMMSTIASQVDCIDPYSIDECFANMSGYEGLGTDLTQLGFQIKDKVLLQPFGQTLRRT